MTDVLTDSKLADTQNGAAAASPFDQWLDAARPKTQLWRTVLGVIIVVAIWMLWTFGVMLVYGFAAALFSADSDAGPTAMEALVSGATPFATLVMLSTFLGMWFGVWAALRLLHGPQRFWSLVSPGGRIRWGEFMTGVAIIAVYATVSTAAFVLFGTGPVFRGPISILEWLAILAPMALLLFVQSSGEELFFRGYVMQHLAARFRNPIVWGVLPSLVFGLIHYANGTTPEYSSYYVVATTLFAMTAAVTVWRTGGLSAAMGMHTANNFVGFMIAGSDEAMTSTPLYLTSVVDLMQGAPYDMILLALLLLFVLSPWAPFPKSQLFARRKEIRAAP